MALVQRDAPDERKAPPAPGASAPISMALVLSKYQTLTTTQNDKQAQILFCHNPFCANTHVRKIDGGFAYTCKPCGDGEKPAGVVDVVVNGETVQRYRFKEDDEIHLGCRGAKTDDGEQQIVGCIVCKECHVADPVPMHQGITGECLCCADAKINQPDEAGGGGKRRGRQNKPKSRADEFGPRLPQLEALNRSTYESNAQMETIKEESDELLRAHETEGGGAQRRAELARRKEERAAALEAARVERSTKQNQALQTLMEEQEALQRMEQGISLGPDENDTSVDPRGEEDMQAAAAQFRQDGDVARLRDAFPLCAQYWYGLEPTADEIAAQRAVVDAAEKARDEAATAYELVVAEAEALDGAPGDDYEEDKAEAEAKAKAEADAKGNGKGSKRKRVQDMNEAELAAHQRKLADAAVKRKLTLDEKNDKLAKYDNLLKKAKRWDQARPKIEEQNEAIASMQDEMETMKASTIKKEAAFRAERAEFLEWLEMPTDKPKGWDPARALSNWKKFKTAKRHERGGARVA